jgi:hypothetical protein
MRLRLRYILILTLGGAVWGSLFGIFLGALVGVIYGALAGDVTLGLDGAVLGCFALASLGGVYGLALALHGHRRRHVPSVPPGPSWKASSPDVATGVRV